MPRTPGPMAAAVCLRSSPAASMAVTVSLALPSRRGREMGWQSPFPS
jgi:hypothetical protein